MVSICRESNRSWLASIIVLVSNVYVSFVYKEISFNVPEIIGLLVAR